METLQSTIFIEFDVNTKKITFLRGDNIIDYDSDVTNVYVRVKYKNLSGNTVYLTPSELEDYKFSLYTIKPTTNNVNLIRGEVTDELKENVYGGVIKFEIPRACTNRLGIVKCEIHINQKNKIIASSTFVLDVKQSLVTAFDDELLGDEDFPVLKQLILEIQKDSNINDNDRSKITTYSSDKVENIKKDLDSQINEKANKNEVFTMANMGQDIREAMTGGSVAVIGNQMVGHANLSKKIQDEIGYYETLTGYTGQSFGYAINGSNVAYLYENGGAGNYHIDFNVVSGDVYKIDITTAGTDSIKSVIFTDNNLNVISNIPMTTTTTNEIYDVSVPTGATKMLVSYRNGKTTLIQKMNYYELATKHDIAILDRITDYNVDVLNDITKNDLTIFDNIKNQLEAYETIEYDEATYGYAIKSNKPYLYTNGGAGNSSTIVAVTKSDIYRIEMTTAGTGSIKSIILTDSDDNVISFINLTSTIVEETYNVEIPENATKMYVSFRKGLCKIYKKAVAKIMINTGEGEVPDFYKEHMANKIKTIQQLEMAHGGNGCTFAIITDIHWGSNKKYSPALVKEVMENTNCKFVINNGDSAFSSRGAHNTKENGVADLNAVRKLFNNATNNNFYCVRGNHDNNSTGSADDNPDYLLSENEMYSLLVEKYDHKIVGDIENPTGLYYYFDDNKNKIRHIILDSFEDGQGEGVMSVKQMKWFCEKAVQFDGSGWNICVYTHKPISPFETSQFGEVKAILIAIRYGTQYSISYTDNNSETYDINVDFAGKGHTIMFVANGHAHIDTLKQDNNITYFKSVCDAGYINAVEITDRKGVNSQSFDVVCINKNTRQINLVRIGCGEDRIFTYGENSSIIQNTDMTKK